MLSNAYFLAKFRFGTAENEPAKNQQNFGNYFPNFANPDLPVLGEVLGGAGAREVGRERARHVRHGARRAGGGVRPHHQLRLVQDPVAGGGEAARNLRTRMNNIQ